MFTNAKDEQYAYELRKKSSFKIQISRHLWNNVQILPYTPSEVDPQLASLVPLQPRKGGKL
jgi:hypothetical protein